MRVATSCLVLVVCRTNEGPYEWLGGDAVFYELALSNFVHSDLMLNLHRGRLDDERKIIRLHQGKLPCRNRVASDSRRRGIVDRRTRIERVRRVFFVTKVRRTGDARLYSRAHEKFCSRIP